MTRVYIVRFTNCVDPDQIAHLEQSDRDLHSLHRYSVLLYGNGNFNVNYSGLLYENANFNVNIWIAKEIYTCMSHPTILYTLR